MAENGIPDTQAGSILPNLCGRWNGEQRLISPTHQKWTPQMVAARLEEATSTLRRLPSDRPKGYASSWPPIIREFMEAYGWSDAELRLGPPTADAITRMDEALTWLRWLEPNDVKLVWDRAERIPWKEILRTRGVGRTTAWTKWMSALLQLATRLNMK